jgi:hypothetical protein
MPQPLCNSTRSARALLTITGLLALSACGSQGEAPATQDTAPAAATAASAPPPAAPSAYSGPVVAKEELGNKVCAYTPAEIKETLGFAVSAGVADTSRLESYGMASCVYDGPDNSLRISAFWLEPSQVGPARQGMTMMSGGGTVELLPGDPDTAYLHDQQDNGASLHYLRQNVRIQVQSTSSRVPFATMKPRLLALRRLP